MKNTKTFLLILLLSTLLLSCSQSKKLERFQKRNPEIFQSVKDTVIIRDTIYKTLPGSKADSVFVFKALYDTVYIDNGISHTKVWMVDSNVHVNNTVDTLIVEVIVEKEVIVDKYNVCPPIEEKNHNTLFLILIIIALSIFAIIKIMK